MDRTVFLLKLIVILFLFPAIGICQNKPDCSKLKTGTFYYYPKNSNDRYVMYDDGKTQREINQVTGDSAIGEINWTGDCSFTEKYITLSADMKSNADFFSKHKFVYQVTAVTGNYYVFNGYLDKISGNPIQNDTVWLQEKTHFPNNALFKWLPDTSGIRKTHFSDTSKYALLYVYRPAKLLLCLANYIVYLNDNALCLAQNKSGYVFKIFKEGKVEVKGKFYKKEAAVTLDIKFGKRYYVKTLLPWGVNANLTVAKPEVMIMDPGKGSQEFENINTE